MMPTTSATFDRRIADWLAGDPNEAPETVMSAVIAALPTVRQRRGVRRRWASERRLDGLARATVGVTALVILIVVLSVIAQDRARVGASPSPYVPPRTTFTSSLYGYSLTYSSAVSAYAGQTAWSPGQPWHIRWVADTFEGMWRRFSVVSTGFPEGASVADWIARNVAPGTGPCPDAPVGTWKDGVVAGLTARVRVGRCVVDAVVIADERVYVLSWRTSQPGPDEHGAGLLRSFDHFADTIQFDPGVATAP